MIISKKANDNDADQTARMRRLVCAFVVRKDRFSRDLAHIIFSIGTDRSGQTYINCHIVGKHMSRLFLVF